MPPARNSAKARPDPRPMRFALGAAGLAALSALAAAIVLPPNASLVGQTNPQSAQAQQAAPGGGGVAVPQPIQYVQLQPGQTAPPGARVIDPAAPQPTTIVTKIAAPAQAQAPVIIKTTQSGKVIP